jgi:hypothetical protein
VSVQNPYSMHFQSVWGERAADSSLPAWVRVSSLAFCRHRANGHANFGPRELALLLGKPGENGSWDYVADTAVSRAIAAAKKAGWIADASNAKCLVVPHHAVVGGLGNTSDRCPVHGKCSVQTAAVRSVRNVSAKSA